MWVGGMRTSTMTMSGWCRSTTSMSASPSPTAATTSSPASASSRVSPARSSTESSAITIRTGAPRAGWSARRAGSGPCMPAAVGPRPARPARCRPLPAAGSAPPTPSSVDLHDQPVVAPDDRDRGPRGVGVLGDVGQRLRDDEIGGALDGRGRALGHVDRQGDGHGRAGDDRGQGGVEAPVLEDRRMEAADQLAQLGQGRLGVVVGAGTRSLAGLLGIGLEALLGPARGPSPARPAVAGRRRAGRARCGAARPRRCRRRRPGSPLASRVTRCSSSSRRRRPSRRRPSQVSSLARAMVNHGATTTRAMTPTAHATQRRRVRSGRRRARSWPDRREAS